jgi:hypothetical protein
MSSSEGSLNNTLPVVDDDPTPGVWVDEHPVPTGEEIEDGNRLGQTIDVDDDLSGTDDE